MWEIALRVRVVTGTINRVDKFRWVLFVGSEPWERRRVELLFIVSVGFRLAVYPVESTQTRGSSEYTATTTTTTPTHAVCAQVPSTKCQCSSSFRISPKIFPFRTADVSSSVGGTNCVCMRLQSPLQDGVQYARVRRGEFVMCGFGGCSAPRKYRSGRGNEFVIKSGRTININCAVAVGSGYAGMDKMEHKNELSRPVEDGVSVTLLRCRPAFSGNRFHREISPAPGKLISVCRVASRPWIRNQNQIDRRLFAASPWSRTRLFVFVQRKTIERACIIAGTRRKESSMVGFIIDGRFGNCEMLLPVSSAIISIGHAAIQAGRDLIRRCGHVTPYVEQCVTKR
ncbi:hypothetical protein GEV33_010216 [Tenebrio molitor]|uniref:Uncharacterized protein n=1 Tax=Tenebrio molitor TaxID=7067 RepID=A0A8J6H631_TENMO|nr:hypothetical protein GEV33_010216 [Tenebrio molitor]